MSREELIAAVCNQLWRLDGSDLAAVALIAGFSIEDIADLGGVK